METSIQTVATQELESLYDKGCALKTDQGGLAEQTFREALAMVDRLAPGREKTLWEAKIKLKLGGTLGNMGRPPEEYRGLFEEAVRLADEAGDPELQMQTAANLSLFHVLTTRDDNLARELVAIAEKKAREIGNEPWLCYSLFDRGWISWRLGEKDQARACAREALEIRERLEAAGKQPSKQSFVGSADKISILHLLAFSELELAVTSPEAGRSLAGWIDRMEGALAEARDAGSVDNQQEALKLLADWSAAVGAFDRTLKFAAELEALAVRSGNEEGQVTALSWRAGVLLQTGPIGAVLELNEAIRKLSERSFFARERDLATKLCDSLVLAGTGRVAEGVRLEGEVLEKLAAADKGTRERVLGGWVGDAVRQYLCGEFDTALATSREVLSGWDRQPVIGHPAQYAFLAHAEALIYAGDASAAEAPLKRGLEAGHNLGNADVLAWAYRLRAQIALIQADLESAAADLARARQEALKHGRNDLSIIAMFEGMVAAQRGDADAALRLFEESRQEMRRSEYCLAEPLVLIEIAKLQKGTEAGREAQALAQQLLRDQVAGLSQADEATFLSAFGRRAILAGEL